MKRKILILVNHDVVIYNFRLEIVERLLSEGYEVYISSPNGKRIDKLVEIGCKYIETDIDRHGTNLIKDFKLLVHYIKIIRKVKPYFVLTFTIKPNVYGGIASRILKTKYIANITGLGTAVETEGIMQKITTFLYKIAFKNIDTVFFQNRENQEFFKTRNIVPDKGKLIPGSGVNLERFSVLEYPSNDKIEFVFIARIMKEKGIEQYLEAAKYITRKYPNTVFHICGFCEQAYEEKLNKLENEGVIKYHGMIDDVRKILKKTHCTVHPSYYPEGISNVLLESAASGRAIITTKRSGCREVINDGINGFLINEKDTNDLIKKVEKFINLEYEKKKKMGFEGRKKVEKEFDRQKVIEAYLKKIKKKNR